MALPSEARAALVGSLLDSLDTEVDEDAEAAWAAEVNRRVAELDSGAVKTIPWAEVRRRLAAPADRRPEGLHRCTRGEPDPARGESGAAKDHP